VWVLEGLFGELPKGFQGRLRLRRLRLRQLSMLLTPTPLVLGQSGNGCHPLGPILGSVTGRGLCLANPILIAPLKL
jgi:hypothetical protein